MNEKVLLMHVDFECIGQVARHCDWEQLCVYIREQQNLSLLPKIGSCLFSKVYDYLQSDEKDDLMKLLWEGGRYCGCDGKTRFHFGLRRPLVHWSYGAYIYRHSAVDTPFGVVQKVSDDSIPVDLKELRAINKEQRDNAEYYFEMTKDFICSVSKDLGCNTCDCGCVCNYCSGRGASLQRRNVKFDNIKKI